MPMLSLRQKLIISYLLLISITLAVSIFSLLNLSRLRKTVSEILINNYRSILAAEQMDESLEREQSSAAFSIAGRPQDARAMLDSNTAEFSRQYQIAQGNITQRGEAEIVAQIRQRDLLYRDSINAFISKRFASSAEGWENYFATLVPQFNALHQSLDDLRNLNQEAMLGGEERAKVRARHLFHITLLFSCLGVLLGAIFAIEFTVTAVRPLTSLARIAKRIGEGDLDQRIEVRSRDEVGQLAAEFNRMAVRLREIRDTEAGRQTIDRELSTAVLESIFQPVIVTDSNGLILGLNRAASEVMGESGGDVANAPGGDIILKAVRDAVSMQRAVANEGEASLLPMRIGQAERSYRLRTTPMRNAQGRLLGAVTVLEDVTALRDLDRFKTRFIAQASERLQEPLHGLRTALYAVTRGFGGELRPLQAELLDGAKESAERLDTLMTDLIELAELDMGRRPLEEANLRPIDLIRYSLERFRAAARSKQVELNYRAFPDLAHVSGDPRAVRSIFENLVSNALRYTPAGGTVTLEADEKKDYVQFYVRDTGRGIEPERLPGIFGRFNSVGGGTGLGLALVRRLVESQGGQVAVESKLGQGTSFSFTLPVTRINVSRHPVETG